MHILILIALIPIAWVLFVVAGRFAREWLYLHPPRKPLSVQMASLGVPDLAVVEFDGGDGAVLRGWGRPSKNGAGVVFVHGTEANRCTFAHEVVRLSEAGFGVLSFDLPGHGESTGQVNWGESERRAVRRGVEWMAGHGQASKVGVLGFSYGGYIATQVAVTDKSIDALVLSGTPSDVEQLTRFQSGGKLRTWATLLADKVLYEPDVRKAVTLISEISPRPVLIIHGSDDQVVPASMAQSLYDAAREPRELWVVQGGGHGHFSNVVGEEYSRRLIEFYTKALLGADNLNNLNKENNDR